MDKKLIDWWAGGLNPYVAAWKTQATTDGGAVQPSSTVLNALGTLITTLGPTMWARFKTFNVLHTGDKFFAKVNLKDPSTYKWTESGTVTFSQGNGCKSASSSYFNQGFKSNAFAGNALTFMQYISESDVNIATIASHGHRTKAATASNNYLLPHVTPGQTQASQGSTNATTVANTNHKGLYMQTYVGTTIVIYKDGTKATTAATLQTPDISTDRFILARNTAAATDGITPLQYYTKYVAIDAILDQISDADELAIRTAIEAYKTAVGLP